MRRSRLTRYGLPVVATAVALGLRLLLIPLLTQESPFLLFFASVLVSAVYGGFGPGVFATVLAGLCNNYYFMPPFGQFTMTTDQFFRLTMFAIEGLFISLICARLQSSRQAVEDAASEARALERRILETSDAEQRRIGHDLHDGLGQHLTGIALMMRRLHKHLVASASPEAADAEKVASLANTAVEWTHDLCRSLSPAALESSGLSEGLRELAANAENIFKVQCVFESHQEPGVDKIDLEAASHLYRIAQEAISNAVRHGKATKIELSIITKRNLVEVTVADNGAGLDPADADSDGMGLRIMRYRAKMIGADVTVERRKESSGTVVACRYPIVGRAHQIPTSST